MKSLRVSATIAAVLFSGSAYASSSAPAGNWYFGASGDLTWLRNSDTGGGGNADIGFTFWPNNYGDFRIEAEAGYHGAGGSDGYSSTHYFTYMGNLYYDFATAFAPTSSGWHEVPYVGGGLGDAAVHFGGGNFTSTFHHHEDDFAYQGMGGLTFASASMPGIDWSLGYRYLGTDTDDLHANNLELGVKFHF